MPAYALAHEQINEVVFDTKFLPILMKILLIGRILKAPQIGQSRVRFKLPVGSKTTKFPKFILHLRPTQVQITNKNELLWMWLETFNTADIIWV